MQPTGLQYVKWIGAGQLRESKAVERLIKGTPERMSAAKFRGGGQNQGSPSRSREGEGYRGLTFQTLCSPVLVLTGGRPRGRGRVHVSPSISCLGGQKDNRVSNREFRMGPSERCD